MDGEEEKGARPLVCILALIYTKICKLMSVRTPSLPTEIWQQIGSHLEAKDQSSLLLINRLFQAIFSPVLYRRLTIRGPDRRIGDASTGITTEESRSKFALAGPVTSRLLQRLESSEKTRGWVQHCQIKNFRSQIAWISWNKDSDQIPPLFRAFQALMQEIFLLVGNFPLLKGLHLLKAEIPSESLFYLCSRPHLSLSIDVVGVAFFGTNEADPGMAFTPVRFNSEVSQLRHVMQSFITLTLGCSLRELALGTEAEMHLRKFYQAHMDYPGVSLPRLEVLTISWFIAEYSPFFRSTPNLVELRLHGMVRMSLGDAPLDSSLIPKLKRFYGHNCFLPYFIPGRPVHTIETRSSTGPGHVVFLGQEDNISLKGLNRRFGSAVDVIDLTWDNCNQNQELLQYLIAHNRKLTHLELTPTLPYTEEQLHDRLELVKELKCLRTLYIRCLTHVPSERTLSWEREHCESLQREGSGVLVSVSFSSLIDWNRENGSSIWTPSGSGMPVHDMIKLGEIFMSQDS